MIKISIIVPIYNVDRYLEKCIQSILDQTFEDFELILVNDGSTDNSGIICDGYKNKDSRIKVINKENGGLSSARNAGLDIACGKYIGFVDSDDYIHPQMYEILYKYIELNNCDISICDFKYVYDSNYKYENVYIDEISIENFHDKECLNQIYGDKSLKFIVMWNKLYKRELFNNLRFEEGRIHEDEFIAHKLLYKCSSICYINKNLYCYLQRDGSVMKSKFSIKSLDAVWAREDRVKFFRSINNKTLTQLSELYYTEILIGNYYKVENELSNPRKILKLLKGSFKKNIKYLIRNPHYNYKEKTLLIVFCLNSNLYKLYNELKYRRNH